MKFRIEQIAIAPANPIRARQLLAEMGAKHWTVDQPTAIGFVQSYTETVQNLATLQFNYEIAPAPVEFEMLHYVAGPNWLEGAGSTVSHLGMHCTEKELEEWKDFFSLRNIGIAQEVETTTHTNKSVTGNYHYCIFDTRRILGVDLKFIVRFPE